MLCEYSTTVWISSGISSLSNTSYYADLSLGLLQKLQGHYKSPVEKTLGDMPERFTKGVGGLSRKDDRQIYILINPKGYRTNEIVLVISINNEFLPAGQASFYAALKRRMEPAMGFEPTTY